MSKKKTPFNKTKPLHSIASITILLCILLLPSIFPSSASLAKDEPSATGPQVQKTGPEAAPEAPDVAIAAVGVNIELSWEHADVTTSAYQIWRSANQPYFEPTGAGQMLDNYTFPASLYGVFEAFTYVDDGVCGYFTAPPSAPGCTNPQSPTATVLGDVANNYTWVVRAGNDSAEYDISNRVGEFDFALTPGS